MSGHHDFNGFPGSRYDPFPGLCQVCGRNIDDVVHSSPPKLPDGQKTWQERAEEAEARLAETRKELEEAASWIGRDVHGTKFGGPPLYEEMKRAYERAQRFLSKPFPTGERIRAMKKVVERGREVYRRSIGCGCDACFYATGLRDDLSELDAIEKRW